MGQQMPVKKVALAFVCVALAIGCGANSGPNTSSTLVAGPSETKTTNTAQMAAAQGTSITANAAASLEECSLAHVTVAPAALPIGSVDQKSAERAAGIIGAASPAAVAIPALVTIGERWGQAATADSALKDAHGRPVFSRAAWALVYREQSIQRPSGGPAQLVTTWAPRQLPLVSVVAAIVDARTGEFIMGWGCNQP
jgi:hypothetical protein